MFKNDNEMVKNNWGILMIKEKDWEILLKIMGNRVFLRIL